MGKKDDEGAEVDRMAGMIADSKSEDPAKQMSADKAMRQAIKELEELPDP